MSKLGPWRTFLIRKQDKSSIPSIPVVPFSSSTSAFLLGLVPSSLSCLTSFSWAIYWRSNCRMVMTVDLTRPTVEMLANADYRHPYFSMFPPTRVQIREAMAVRRARAEALKAAKDAEAAAAQAEKEAKEKEAEAAAKEKEKADKEAEEAKQAEAAAAAEKAAKWVQVPVQTDMGYCYHTCAAHKPLEQPMIKGKLGCECQSKKSTEKSGQKATDKSNEKQLAKESKKDKKADVSNDEDAADEPVKAKPVKDKQDKSDKQEKQPKGILKESKQSKVSFRNSFHFMKFGMLDAGAYILATLRFSSLSVCC